MLSSPSIKVAEKDNTNIDIKSWFDQITLDQMIMFVVIVVGVLVLMSAIFAVLQCLLKTK